MGLETENAQPAGPENVLSDLPAAVLEVPPWRQKSEVGVPPQCVMKSLLSMAWLGSISEH